MVEEMSHDVYSGTYYSAETIATVPREQLVDELNQDIARYMIGRGYSEIVSLKSDGPHWVPERNAYWLNAYAEVQ